MKLKINKTDTFKEGDRVVMHTCGEAEYYKGKVWTCKTHSYKDLCGQDVIFLEGFTGCFLTEYLQLIDINTI